MRLLQVMLVSFVFVGGAFAQQQPPAPKITFQAPPYKKALEQFLPKWDVNKNDRLDRNEIAALLRDGSIRSIEAAALATSHFWFLKSPDKKSATLSELISDIKETMAFANGSLTNIFKMEKEYEFYLVHLFTSSREMFGSKKLGIDGISQGHMGNCFFVSMAGNLAFQNPDAIRNMIKPNEDGSNKVEFPDGRSVRINKLPEAVIALGSRTGNQGTWINLLEEAYGEVYKPIAPGDTAVIGLDRISRGGNIGETISLLTGHQSDTIAWKSGLPEDLLNIRYLLGKGVKNKSLMGAGVPLDLKKPPPAIVVGHAYAVLNYDEAKDLITLWNPHGNDFKPMGPEGFINGYETKGGVFTLSSRDFSFLFNYLFVETNKPISNKR
jgi:hypothetical protein